MLWSLMKEMNVSSINKTFRWLRDKILRDFLFLEVERTI